MKVAVIKERFPGEHRVALVPTVVGALVKSDHDVLVESDAGLAAGFSDTDYEQAGGTIVSRDDAFEADCILTIRACGAAGETWESDRKRMSKKSVIIGMVDPLGDVQACLEDAKTGATIYALELVPRITRAQSMDVLSSQANIAGYEAVLLGATALKKILPMMTTAAGTIRPAKALILGAGVAGLQAIATAKRLGAQVLAYDVRPAVKEQVESLGAKFVELDLETQSSETKGGYAKAMTDEFYKKQQELLGKVISECDLVVTTALIPGKPAPLLITKAMVEGMEPGSVIVDLAAERGGNCEMTTPGETTCFNGITILGPTNLPAEVATHTSQLYSKNIVTFLNHLISCGFPQETSDDEICQETLIAQNGQVVHARVRDLAGMPTQPSDPSSQEGGDTPSSQTS
ncbi:MAG: Re/Si-specific NAD(P)(+) transhydrogenase subunit alpha [Pirellulales bacterium]|nr:Re/Si-specific NAD(P)(+) transhydrogenase subunit alpha [Pirellulales bacterium]MEE2797613.1 Re/Si-specific NAD(P)(+) transhydrogenase subunit alpha [Planctomycetota bacterium]